MSKLISDSIKNNDFINLKHIILIRNNTSGTEIVNPDIVSVIEFFNDGISISMPKNSCREAHMLHLFIFSKDLKKQIRTLPESGGIKGSLEVIGKVYKINMEENSDAMMTVFIEFNQYDVDLWKSFVSKYLKHQEQIDRFSKVRLS